jgi:DNA-binding NarL/FixJ family response regulator
VARVVALVPDLLFGSRVKGALEAAGHEVALEREPGTAREQSAAADVLVVDLTAEEFDGCELVEGLTLGDALTPLRTLAFYAHVDTEVRERAEQAGFDRVVPRSRMAREGAALVEALVAEGGEQR